MGDSVGGAEMSDSNGLLVRMNRLERQHRRLRLFFTGTLVLFGVGLISGQARPQASKQEEPLRSIEAQEFVLVDAKSGQIRGVWGMRAAGSTGIELYDKAGTRRASIGITEGGATALQIYDKSGIVRASLGNTSVHGAKTGKQRVLAESSLLLFDKDGIKIFEAP